MPRFETMAKSKKSKSKRSASHAGLAKERASRNKQEAKFEDIGDQHGLLREDLMLNIPRVNAGGLVPIKQEQEAESTRVPDAELYEALHTEYLPGSMQGFPLTESDDIHLAELLRDEERSWLALFEASLDFPANRSILDRYYDHYNPDARRSIILYVGNILKAMGFTIAKIEEEDTYNYPPYDIIETLDEFRRFVYRKLCDNGWISIPSEPQRVAARVDTKLQPQPSQKPDPVSQSRPTQAPAPVQAIPVVNQPAVPTSSPPQPKPNRPNRSSLLRQSVSRLSTRFQPTRHSYSGNKSSSDDSDSASPGGPSGVGSTRKGSRHFVPANAIAKFSGKIGEAEEWLNNFVYIANQAGWTNKLWCSTFRFRMEGSALWWYKSLSSSVQKKWSLLHKAFRDAYEIGSTSPAARYWNASRKENETPLQFLVRLNALAKMAKIDRLSGDSASEHVQQFLTQVRDNSLREKFVMMGTKSITEVEARLRDMERGDKNAKRFSNKPGDDKRRPDQNGRKANYGRAAPAYNRREVRWADEDRYEYDEEDYDYYEDEEEYHTAYSASEEPSHPPRYDNQRRDTPSYYRRREGGYPPRQFEDWSQMVCRECKRQGHPTDRCLFKCKTCHKVHENEVCPVSIKLGHLAKFVATNKESLSVPTEIQEILKDLNF